ncbi:tRNA (adenosine(37)-N6)-threonylcarbamoyltransferase complex dimerization subunit type 1 TsaB [Flavobacterium sp. CBA20B-1]|uniref:tRNA (adenosine(37)-N6)-threonylcarbamoyltransferase complex dimerization subunit type 1 TsaB n=1 Tax=unclassified Flavobacterium TaxID=196869 RepID=UPI0022256B76|nr:MULTISPECIES: tRNA (adenosine(37)-N6)-threonylcarbamoyltransferase complex dimerization subunit type 1 TsaB [unclassified Flavobacterium]WCM41751.1 tRNA (adenosine(37)-N6)-threonylcarbamoyltransferase complex dimerization subunit type 1 TsaB [Flavobacterium sp. CBA20B-1]
MVYILNIETATKNCSVSLGANGTTIAFKELSEEQFNHAEKLHVFIKDVINQASLDLSQLHAVAVSKGPGSYTGLRIGVSAAKGLCYALDIPLIAVDTLAVLAAQISVANGLIIPMIDARRMEVFTQQFDEHHKAITPAEALIIDETAFADKSGNMHFVGDGALKCKTVLTSDTFVFHEDVIYPSAKEMSPLSYEKFQQNDFVDVAYFEPYYLKDFMLTTKK